MSGQAGDDGHGRYVVPGACPRLLPAGRTSGRKLLSAQSKAQRDMDGFSRTEGLKKF